MSAGYKDLYKYELKKLIWLYLALLIFFILRGTNYFMLSYEAGSIVTETTNYSINFRLLDPDFDPLDSIVIFILVYIQFKNNFKDTLNTFNDKDFIAAKLITGVFTIFLFALISGIIVLFRFNTYADIYRDVLLTLNIDPAIISPGFIVLTVFTIFAVYVFMYFFTILVRYFTGSSVWGICLSLLLLHLPILIISAFDLSRIIPPKIICCLYPHYFCRGCDFFDNNYYDNISIHLNTGIFNKFNISSVIFYLILSAIILIVLCKLFLSQKYIESNKPFASKGASLIFKLAFTADFFFAGLSLMFTENNIPASILIGIFFGLFGFALSHTIVKKQEVHQ